MSPQGKKVSHTLGEVARREVGVELDKEHQTADWGVQITEPMRLYAGRDSRVVLLLAESFESRIKEAGLERTMEIEQRALPALSWMAKAGVPFDGEGWREQVNGIGEEKARLVEELNNQAPDHPDGKEWNWNSHTQVKEAFGLLGIKLPDTKEETLSRYDHPLARVLLKYRKATKLMSTYGHKLLEMLEDGRFYPSWWQIGAGTGRMACSSPNLQNLPPEVRRYVKALEGRMLVKADYSQIELRIAAKISGDKRMLQAFAEGEDIHTITARTLTRREKVTNQERQLAKAVNFGLLYGMSPKGLRNYARSSYGVKMTLKEAKRYWQDFFDTYPGLKAWHDREYRELTKGNTETRTLTGRRRTSITKLTERLNSPVQGTGADGLKLALALCYERRHECPGAVPILAVHDEVVVECDEEQVEEVKAWLEKAMVDGMNEVLNAAEVEGPHVPIKVEITSRNTWGE